MSELLTEQGVRDEFGMTAREWREERAVWRAEFRRQRWAALKAIWGVPIKSPARDRRKGWTINDGFERNRDEEWTLRRALVCSVALLLNRTWAQTQEDRHGRAFGTTIAYFDARSTYGGYEIMLVQIYPRCRMSVFSDGECLM